MGYFPSKLRFVSSIGLEDVRNTHNCCHEWWMNEWMMHLYSAFCVLLYTQSALRSCGGVSPQSPPVCSIHLDYATAATGQRRQCAHHTPATGGEEREIEPIKLIIRRPWLTRASGGNLARRVTPYSLWEVFNDHRVSGPRFNVSSERWCLLTV